MPIKAVRFVLSRNHHKKEEFGNATFANRRPVSISIGGEA